jgi:hypothetical protein
LEGQHEGQQQQQHRKGQINRKTIKGTIKTPRNIAMFTIFAVIIDKASPMFILANLFISALLNLVKKIPINAQLRLHTAPR